MFGFPSSSPLSTCYSERVAENGVGLPSRSNATPTGLNSLSHKPEKGKWETIRTDGVPFSCSFDQGLNLNFHPTLTFTQRYIKTVFLRGFRA